LAQDSLASNLISRYANEENGILAQQGREGASDFIINKGSYKIELLALEDDQPIGPGATGRVVVTDLFSYAMPFVRYDTGDLARFSSEGTSMLAEIIGRKRDILYDWQNRPVLPAVVSQNMTHFTGIRQYQFAQVGEATYSLHLEASPDADREAALRRMVTKIFGEGVTFNIAYVNDVGTMPSGKRRPVANTWTDRPSSA
jgi:phenylacetate-CoA ligase